MIPTPLFNDLRRRSLKRGAEHDSILTHLESLFIEHPAFQQTVDEVVSAIELHGRATMLPNLQISGASGIGKTTLLKKLAARYPRNVNGRKFTLANGEIARCDEIPLLCAEMPVKPSVEALARAMLKAFGDPKYDSGTKSSVESRLRVYIYACSTRTIIIDESQRAVDRNGTIVKQEIAFWLQDLYENNYITLILVGLGRTNFLFEQDAQVERRWDAEIRMEPYQWGVGEVGPDSRLHFIALLVAFKENLPLEWPADLDLEDDINCIRFYYASRGVVGLLKKLFHALLRIVIAQKLTCITMFHFQKAFEKAFRKTKGFERLDNPFDNEWEATLPPLLDDDTQLINPPARVRKRQSKKASAAELTYALTVA